MENQISVGDQNTQQIGKNPVSEPVQIPEKPRVNYWVITSVVFVVLLIVIALSWFLVRYKPNEKSYVQKQNMINTSSQITPTQTPGYPNKEKSTIDMPKSWTLDRDWLKVYIPQEALPANSKVAFMLVPEPADENLSNIPFKDTFQVSGFDNGNELKTLKSNMVIYQPIDVNNPRLALLHKETLNYYYWDKDKSEWILIPSSINFEKGYALAEYNRFGTFSFRGNPINKPPKIFSIEPNKIKYNQDVVLTIRGENLRSDSSVNFGMGAYNFEFVDSSTIRVQMKEDNNFLISPGTYTLVIGNPDYQRAHFSQALVVEE